jgi:hypothetical protein
MADNVLYLGSTTATAVNLPPSYNYDPNWLESVERTIDGSLIVNQVVTSSSSAVQKRRFSFSGIQQFTSTFSGSTVTTGCVLDFLGSTYSVHIISQNYRYLYQGSTSAGNIVEYSYVLEEE